MSQSQAQPLGAQAGSYLRRFAPGLVGIYLLAVILALLVRPIWQGVLAPLAGPWAGHLYGHAGCTMASAMPTASLVVVGVLPLVLVVAILGRRHAQAVLPLLLWALVWSALAWMSVVNSTE